jgi:endonuclease-8
VPEGDTIYRAAAALRTALVGHVMTHFEAPYLDGIHPQVGRVIEEIESFGKHLEFAWDDGVVLHTHLRMTGSWHLYHPGERWRRPQREMVASIGVDQWRAVCFNAPTVETYRSFDKRRHPGFGHVGPDLCKDHPDLDACLDRMDRFTDPDEPIAEVLLDQRIACGVGNVYKSEVLWRCGVNPFRAIREINHETRRQLIEMSAEMLRANRHRIRRVTAPEAPGGLAVYGRHGLPCPRCGDAVKVKRTGQHLRATYWCPTCQAAPERALLTEVTPTGLVRPIAADPHPAAAMFLRELAERRARYADLDLDLA